MFKLWVEHETRTREQIKTKKIHFKRTRVKNSSFKKKRKKRKKRKKNGKKRKKKNILELSGHRNFFLLNFFLVLK